MTRGSNPPSQGLVFSENSSLGSQNAMNTSSDVSAMFVDNTSVTFFFSDYTKANLLEVNWTL